MTDRLRTVLVVDDDRAFCAAARDALSGDGTNVLAAHSAKDGLAVCAQHAVDVILLDQKLPDADGHALCPSLLAGNEQAKIIFITAFPSFDNALRALKAGAYDYLSKPFEMGQLALAVGNALRVLEFESARQLLRYKDDKEGADSVLVGRSGTAAEIRRLARLAAAEDVPVLITGETGTGKGILARLIHHDGASPRTGFVSVNCAALPGSLIEAELFGHEKGAFTGADAARKGLFEMAAGGTLLLDEIGEMPPPLQAKLLGAIEEKAIRRIGGATVRPVDVRVVATTNVDLEAAVARGAFRRDLYYRLNVMRIPIPPLRERREDVPDLCAHFVRIRGKGRAPAIPADDMTRLISYDWPGNVRELRNVIERSLVVHRDGVLHPADLLGNISAAPPPLVSSDVPPAGPEPPLRLDEVERRHIADTLSRQSGNLARSARALGISLSTLKRKIRRFRLAPTRPF